MTGIHSLNNGIKAIQSGSLAEGERHLVLALRDKTLSPSIRAAVHIWMAETKSDLNFKIQCYQQALTEDPSNQAAKERLNVLLAAALPPLPQENPTDVPLPSRQHPTSGAPQAGPQPPSPVVTNAFFRTVGIAGTNGPATGFFITNDGLLATTRFAVSGLIETVINLEGEKSVKGNVVRSFPEFDLSLIQTEVRVSRTLPFARTRTIPDNMPLTAISHTGKALQGVKRETKRELKSHWIPTNFRKLSDAGGNPLLDRNNHVVGMLTRVSSRSSDEVFGLEINHIQKCVEEYLHEAATITGTVYCHKCGNRSVAGSLDGFYCEHCGGVLHTAEQTRRFVMPELDRVYGENMSKLCPHCGARVGYWDGRCLRCGRESVV